MAFSKTFVVNKSFSHNIVRAYCTLIEAYNSKKWRGYRRGTVYVSSVFGEAVGLNHSRITIEWSCGRSPNLAFVSEGKRNRVRVYRFTDFSKWFGKLARASQ